MVIGGRNAGEKDEWGLTEAEVKGDGKEERRGHKGQEKVLGWGLEGGSKS